MKKIFFIIVAEPLFFFNFCLTFAQTSDCNYLRNKQKELTEQAINEHMSYDRLHVRNVGDIKMRNYVDIFSATRSGLYGQDLTIDFVITMEGDSVESYMSSSSYELDQNMYNFIENINNISSNTIKKNFIINTTVTFIAPVEIDKDANDPLRLRYNGVYGNYLVKHYTDLEQYGRQTLVALANTKIKQPLFNQAFAVLLAYGIEYQLSTKHNIISSEISINRFKIIKPSKTKFKIQIASQIIFKDLYIKKYDEIKLLENKIKTLEEAILILNCEK